MKENMQAMETVIKMRVVQISPFWLYLGTLNCGLSEVSYSAGNGVSFTMKGHDSVILRIFVVATQQI